VRDDANVYGPLSVGVPGFLAGVGRLWERWGRLRWPEIVAPARELLESLSYDLIRGAVAQKRDAIAQFLTTAAYLDQRNWPGRELTDTLDRISATGWHAFYDGELGRTIADFVTSLGGILTRADMAAFAPRITEPLTSTYRDAIVHTAIAPNGGFSVLEALVGQVWPPGEDVADWEKLAHVLRKMWRRRLGTHDVQASPHGTIHVASADCEGNLVSMTISQGGLFGSCLAVPGTGIILGHGMCRFDPHPGGWNSPGPRKRPLNNVCPLIIRMPDRDVAIGARGGRRIVSVAVRLAQRIVQQGASVYQAADAPRMHVLGDGPLEISRNFDTVIRAELEARGHTIEVSEEVAGAAHGAEILKDGTLRAGGNTWAVGV
jgi:gamma-glutamyltranspeptidase/glutathione hydrolase